MTQNVTSDTNLFEKLVAVLLVHDLMDAMRQFAMRRVRGVIQDSALLMSS
jgi:hypothetical protein